MRRFIALAGTAALALSLAPFGAAHAQDAGNVVVSITKPAAGSVSGSVTVEGSVSIVEPTVRSLDSVTVTLIPAAGGDPYGTFCTKEFPVPDPAPGGAPQVTEYSFSFTWNSARMPAAGGSECTGTLPADGSLSTNNKYKIKVTAETHPIAEEVKRGEATSGELKLNNTPATPSGVKLGYTKSNRTISVEWAKNAEPDVTDYRVQECRVDKSSKPCASDAWKTVADNYRDTKLAIKDDGPGIYRYRVLALRPNADGGTMVSGPAMAEGDPTEIEVKEDPPETTTTQPQVAGEQQAAPQPKTIVRPTRRVERAAPQVVQRIVEEEPGYNTELPYQGEEAISGLPIDESGEGEGQRAILIPLAGGALLLVFAMQVHYLNRRANHALETVAPAGDADWDGGWDG